MEVIDRANTTLVLMNLLLDKLGLEKRTNHIKFVETFSHLQSDARAYEKELTEIFRSGVEQELKNGSVQDPVQN